MKNAKLFLFFLIFNASLGMPLNAMDSFRYFVDPYRKIVHEDTKKYLAYSVKEDPNFFNKLDKDNKKTLLYTAIEYEDYPLAEFIIASGSADVNVKNPCISSMSEDMGFGPMESKEETALHIACDKNNLEIARLLLQQKAEVSVKNAVEKTPLAIICEKINYERRNNSQFKTSFNKKTAFEIVKLLAQNATTEDTNTCLNDACSSYSNNYNLDIAKLLLENAKSIKGCSLSFSCFMPKNSVGFDIARLIVERDASTLDSLHLMGLPSLLNELTFAKNPDNKNYSVKPCDLKFKDFVQVTLANAARKGEFPLIAPENNPDFLGFCYLFLVQDTQSRIKIIQNCMNVVLDKKFGLQFILKNPLSKNEEKLCKTMYEMTPKALWLKINGFTEETYNVRQKLLSFAQAASMSYAKKDSEEEQKKLEPYKKYIDIGIRFEKDKVFKKDKDSSPIIIIVKRKAYPAYKYGYKYGKNFK